MRHKKHSAHTSQKRDTTSLPHLVDRLFSNLQILHTLLSELPEEQWGGKDPKACLQHLEMMMQKVQQGQSKVRAVQDALDRYRASGGSETVGTGECWVLQPHGARRKQP